MRELEKEEERKREGVKASLSAQMFGDLNLKLFVLIAKSSALNKNNWIALMPSSGEKKVFLFISLLKTKSCDSLNFLKYSF